MRYCQYTLNNLTPDRYRRYYAHSISSFFVLRDIVKIIIPLPYPEIETTKRPKDRNIIESTSISAKPLIDITCLFSKPCNPMSDFIPTLNLMSGCL